MQIILGKSAGFCYGVKRAVDGANRMLENKNPLYSLGEIVHNKEVTKSLEDKGLIFIDDIKYSKGDTIIRAHGVASNIYEYANNNQINLYDFTCPRVLKIHNIALEYKDKGYYIILLGSKNHPENIGTISYCGVNSCIVEDIKELDNILLKLNNFSKVLVIAQTTFSLKKYFIIKNYLENNINRNIDIVFKNTICKATEVRQKETEEISKKVDFMIIIGGRNSSNTKKLYEIASENTKTICIETYRDLDLSSLDGVEKLGIMAGASTPKESIDEVTQIVSNYKAKVYKK